MSRRKKWTRTLALLLVFVMLSGNNIALAKLTDTTFGLTAGGKGKPVSSSQMLASGSNAAAVGTGSNALSLLRTVTFMVEEEIYTTVSVLVNDSIDEPEVPDLPAGMRSFLGWYTEDGERYDFTAPVTADFTLYGEFSDKFLVQFMVNGLVVDSVLVSEGQNIGPTEYQPTPPAGAYFAHWYELGEDETVRYDFQAGVTENLVLVPYFTNAHYVFFYSQGTPVPEQLVIHGETVDFTGIEPTRAGYQFLGWTKDPEGEVLFDEETAITQTMTLYALWEAEEVQYTVVYWLEKPNLADDFDIYDYNNYSFAYARTRQAFAGTTVTEDADDFAALQLEAGYKNELAYSAFNHSGSKTVLGNGTTVLNVYCTRISYTLSFNLGSSTTYTGHYRAPDGTVYNSGTDEPLYSITAKFEQDIYDVWPSMMYDEDGQPNFYTSGDIMYFGGWYQPSGYGFESGRVLVSKRITLNTDLIPSNGATEYTLTPKWNSSKNIDYWQYAVEALNQDEAEGMANSVLFENQWFIVDDVLSQYVFSSNSSVMAKEIDGLSPYSVVHWVAEDGTLVKEASKAHADENGTRYLYLFYTRVNYKLTYDTQGAESYPPLTYQYQQPIEEPEDPVRSGYSFTGWYVDADCRELYDFTDAIMPNRDLMLFAGWESVDHKVTFYDEVNGEIASTVGVATNAFVAEPEYYQTGQGYPEKGTFVGWYWYDNSGRFTTFSFEIPVTRDMNVYAVWKTDGFALNYDGNGHTSGNVPNDDKTYTLNKLALVQPADIMKGDQNLIGWQINGEGLTYYPGNGLEMYQSIDLYALYTTPGITYKTITFNGNGGVWEDDIASIEWIFEQGSTDISLSGAPAFTAENKILAGWSENPDAQVPDYELDDVYAGPLDEDIVLYGIWVPDKTFSITFFAGRNGYFPDGDDYTSQVVIEEIPVGASWGEIFNDSATGIQVPEPLCYNNEKYFAGWNPDILADDGMIVEDLYYEAIYKNKEKLTIIADSLEKEYDGNPLSSDNYQIFPEIDADLEGLIITGEITNVGQIKNAVDFSNLRILDNGEDVTKKYTITTEDGTLKVTPRPATITVDNKVKDYLAKDPIFTGSVEGLIGENDLGEIIYRRATGQEDIELAGVQIRLTADYTENENYMVTVSPGQLWINKPSSFSTSGGQDSITETIPEPEIMPTETEAMEIALEEPTEAAVVATEAGAPVPQRSFVPSSGASRVTSEAAETSEMDEEETEEELVEAPSAEVSTEAVPAPANNSGVDNNEKPESSEAEEQTDNGISTAAVVVMTVAGGTAATGATATGWTLVRKRFRLKLKK